MKKEQIIVALVALLIGFSGGYVFGGKMTEKGDRQFKTNGSQMGGGQIRSRMGGQVVGEIINIDDRSMTVKMSDESSKIVLISEKTNINKALEAGMDDLEIGEKVMVFGTTNSDGSVTAQNVQLNPTVRGRPSEIPQ